MTSSADDRHEAASPAPTLPYTSVVRAGDWVVVSGQVGVADGELVAGGIAPETTQTVANIERLLASESLPLSSVVKTLCFLVDVAEFEAFNAAYREAFGGHLPARSTVQVAALPHPTARVEIEAWAHVPSAR